MPSRPRWDFPRVTLAAAEMVSVGSAHGLPADRLLAGSGLTLEDLSDPERSIDAGQELAVARNLVAQLDDPPGLGFEVAARFSLSSFGLLGFALTSSPTLREAARVGLRYLDLGHAFLDVGMRETGDHVQIVFDDTEVPADVRSFMVERDIGVILAVVVSNFIGPAVLARLHEARLELTLDPARGAALLADLPEGLVRFGGRRNMLTFPADFLDQATQLPNSETARLCEAQCEELLQRRFERHGMAARIRGRMLRTPAEIPNAQTAAAELNIDRRTLHRRLTSEGTTYRALREEVRKTLALEMLTVLGLTVDETAHRLGYSDSSALTHAVTRWTGHPPGQYKRKTPPLDSGAVRR
jgi:AraC-like DNA-binding protein